MVELYTQSSKTSVVKGTKNSLGSIQIRKILKTTSEKKQV